MQAKMAEDRRLERSQRAHNASRCSTSSSPIRVDKATHTTGPACPISSRNNSMLLLPMARHHLNADTTHMYFLHRLLADDPCVVLSPPSPPKAQASRRSSSSSSSLAAKREAKICFSSASLLRRRWACAIVPARSAQADRKEADFLRLRKRRSWRWQSIEWLTSHKISSGDLREKNNM